MEHKKKPKKKLIAAIIAVAAVAVTAVYITTVYAAKPDEDEALLREYPVTREI
jgi:hypothetical protein